MSEDEQPTEIHLMDAFCAWFDQANYQQAHEEFVRTHCMQFDGASPDGEQLLEWTEIFNAYTAIFDVALKNFVDQHGTTVQDFLACAGAEEGLAAIYLQILLASTEYDAFVSMMAQECENLKEAS